jgi:hypothetical protein
MTGYGRDEDRKMVHPLGLDLHLVKPTARLQFAQVFGKALRLASLALRFHVPPRPRLRAAGFAGFACFANLTPADDGTECAHQCLRGSGRPHQFGFRPIPDSPALLCIARYIIIKYKTGCPHGSRSLSSALETSAKRSANRHRDSCARMVLIVMGSND